MTAWLKSRAADAGRSRRGTAARANLRPVTLAVAGAVLVAGCAMLGSGGSQIAEGVERLSEGVDYYWQSVTGHLSILEAAEPVDELLAQPQLDARTRQRLELASRIRRFAVTDLGLPDNGSYTRFADLGRPFATWGVVAAPELSLRLTQWCFPIAGCVTYRGYYSLDAAEAYAAGLTAQGLDVQVNGVPAYSTLGWLDDPLLSTFINYPDAEVARLVFHELSHQVVYVKGDSMFNESFATAVEQLGVERWLDAQGTPEQRLSYRQQRLRRDLFLELLRRHRNQLAALYAGTGSDEDKREGKRRVFEELKAEYKQMRQGPWAGFAGYDRWFSRPLGNAHLGSVATYTTWVPVFRQLFEESEEDFARFYLKVAELASLDKAERQAFLVRRSKPPAGDLNLMPGAGDPPALQNPALQNPALQNPALQEPALQNPSLQDPALQNPALRSPDEALAPGGVGGAAASAAMPAAGQVHALEQSTGATIPAYR